jgi:hypothetical protein
METSSPDFAKKSYVSASVGVLVAIAAYLVLVISHFNYVPLWDSMENLEEYLFHPREHLTFDNLLLMHNGHPSLGYFLPFWVAQRWFPTDLLAVHLINTLIGCLAIFSFHGIVRRAFPVGVSPLEKALLTLAFAVQPVVVAYALNMSPDYGVLAYFLATFWMLFAQRTGLAAMSGVLLVFSKEIGIVSYSLLVVVYLSGALGGWRWSRLPPLLFPFLCFGLFAWYQRVHQRHLFPWADNFLKGQSNWNVYFPNPLKADFKMACLGPFVFEFQWIFFLVIVAGLAWGLLSGTKPGPFARFGKLHVSFCTFLVLVLGILYVDSRTVIFTNQRYFIVLYPLVLLCFYAAMLQLGLTPSSRRLVLAVTVLLLFACNFRTLDPVSRAVAGTFPFGNHRLLDIASIRPDLGDLNRDEMVYNLEHTHLSTLLDRAFETIRPSNDTVLVIPGDSWWLLSRLDARTFHRTESRRPPYIQPAIKSPNEIVGAGIKPAKIFVMELPYFHNTQTLALLSPFYQTTARQVFEEDGYQIEVVEMDRRSRGAS